MASQSTPIDNHILHEIFPFWTSRFFLYYSTESQSSPNFFKIPEKHSIVELKKKLKNL